MFDVSRDRATEQERAILRKLRVWIAALAVACLVAGIGIGAMLSGHTIKAQNEAQIARAPEALSASFAEIARRVEPAVVNIETTQATPEISDKDDDKDDSSTNNPLLDMFRRQRRSPTRGVGSGFIVNPKGYILTNYHVIEDAARITVILQSNEKFRGEVVGFDPETDVAVIKIDAQRDLPTVALGDSNAAQVGDWVLAMGSPFGLDQTVTAGIISKKERESPYFNVFPRFLPTDAAINSGKSGGPLLNMRGGVHGAIFMSVTPEENGHETPAAKAGLQPNDIIVDFENAPVINAQDLIQRVASTPVGQQVALTFLRDTNGKLEKKTVQVVLGERPSQSAREWTAPATTNSGSDDPRGNALHLGITLAELTPQLLADRHLTGVQGLYVKDIDPNGLIAELRNSGGGQALVVGDVINRINRVPVTSLADFQRVLSGLKGGDPIVLNVTRVQRDPKGDRLFPVIVQFTYQ